MAPAEPEKEDGFTHKTARKGKDRVIFVSDPQLLEIVVFLCKKYPAGPILRNIVWHGGPVLAFALSLWGGLAAAWVLWWVTTS